MERSAATRGLVRSLGGAAIAAACLLGGSASQASARASSPTEANEVDEGADAGPHDVAATYAGEYTLVAGTKSRDAAIEDLIGELNVLIRPMARTMLRDGNPIAKRLTIEVEGDHIVVAFDGKRDVAKVDGTKTKIIGIQGDTLDYHVSVSEVRLRQVYSGARGGRSNNIRVRPGDKLAIAVEMTSPRLPKPLRYRLIYRVR